MKIRTRLLLFLLPAIIGSIALLSALFIYTLKSVMTTGIPASLIDQKFYDCLFLISTCASMTIITVTVALYLIASKISRPIQKLNNAALAIAAGQYGESLPTRGPREVAELANTLNTMSQCLLENINRLKENSLLREQMYGEYECSMLLQHLMLQKNIDLCRSDAIAVKPITFFSECPRGFLLDFPKSLEEHRFLMHVEEAEEEGFEGMYELLTRYKSLKPSHGHTSVILDRTQSVLQWSGPQMPLVWSAEEQKFLMEPLNTIPVNPGDFFFLFNQGLASFYHNQERITAFLAKVLRIFAQDGLETTASMLHKEISFALKRKDLHEDIHLLCFQLLNF